ncbi:MAG: carboxypeptidase regulatory-like domain-containing protein, partial [bacterium]|nr:carboxypeptidase regulatory-like domain-containing protein [bacterium]
MKSSSLRGLALPLLASALVSTASAQLSTGTITGIVTDPSQAVLPGAAVELTSVETGVTTTAEANASGEYTIPLLQPGTYQLTAVQSGFRTYQRGGVVVESGRTIRIDIALEIGQVTETVEVT